MGNKLTKFYLVLLSVAIASPLYARRPVPLMETVPATKPVQIAARPVASSPRITYVERSYRNEGRKIELGAEIGMLGRRQQTNGDFLGMQALWGGRLIANLPWGEQFTLRPSLGYFFKKESVGSVSITQHSFEGGLGAFYTIFSGNSLGWDAGISQRLQWARSSISVYSTSESTPSQFFYRLGPATGVSFQVARSFKILLGYEYTWTVASPARGFSYTSVGLGFAL